MTIRQSLSTAVLTLCTVVAVPAMGQTNSSSRANQNSQSQTLGKAVSKAQADLNKLQTEANKIRARVRTQVLAKRRMGTSDGREEGPRRPLLKEPARRQWRR